MEKKFVKSPNELYGNREEMCFDTFKVGFLPSNHLGEKTTAVLILAPNEIGDMNSKVLLLKGDHREAFEKIGDDMEAAIRYWKESEDRDEEHSDNIEANSGFVSSGKFESSPSAAAKERQELEFENFFVSFIPDYDKVEESQRPKKYCKQETVLVIYGMGKMPWTSSHFFLDGDFRKEFEEI